MKRCLMVLIAVTGFLSGLSAEVVKVSCVLGSKAKVLYMGEQVSYSCAVTSESGVKTIKFVGLPKGLKYDKKNASIVGTPNKSGQYAMSVNVTTKDGTKSTLSLGTVNVPELTGTMIGAFKGAMSHNGKCGLLTMKITNKGKTTGKLVFGDRKYLAIKSGWYTSITGTGGKFLLTFKDNSTIELDYFTTNVGNAKLGVLAKEFGRLAWFSQDYFGNPGTKAAAKKLINRKYVFDVEGLNLVISPNGNVAIKGSYDGIKFKGNNFMAASSVLQGYHIFTCDIIYPDSRNFIRVDFSTKGDGVWYAGISPKF